MALTRESFKKIVLISFIGAWVYLFAFTVITEIFKPDYSGNELNLKAAQTLIKVNAGIYDD